MIMSQSIQQEKLLDFLIKYKCLLQEFNYTLDNEDGCLIDNSQGAYLGFVEVHPATPFNLTINCTTERGEQISISTTNDV